MGQWVKIRYDIFARRIDPSPFETRNTGPFLITMFPGSRFRAHHSDFEYRARAGKAARDVTTATSSRFTGRRVSLNLAPTHLEPGEPPGPCACGKRPIEPHRISGTGSGIEPPGQPIEPHPISGTVREEPLAFLSCKRGKCHSDR